MMMSLKGKIATYYDNHGVQLFTFIFTRDLFFEFEQGQKEIGRHDRSPYNSRLVPNTGRTLKYERALEKNEPNLPPYSHFTSAD